MNDLMAIGLMVVFVAAFIMGMSVMAFINWTARK